jgi:hypothetical protein
MLNAIIRNAIAAEADMTIVEHIAADTDLGSFARRRIDVVLFSAGDCAFTDASIDRLLRANPRLGLLAVDGVQDRGVLHHLVPACKEVCPLSRSSLTEAIRAGAALRRA